MERVIAGRAGRAGRYLGGKDSELVAVATEEVGAQVAEGVGLVHGLQQGEHPRSRGGVGRKGR